MELLTQVTDLSRIGYGFMASKALFGALDLDLFSHLAGGPLSAQDIQQRTQASPNALHTLLRACTSLGLICLEGGRYVNSPAAAAYLDGAAPLAFGDYFRYQIDRRIFPSLLELGDALHGKPTTPVAARMTPPDQAELFSRSQHAGALGPAHLLAGRVDASGWTRLLDVAGGSGAFSIALCQRNPRLHATLIDLPNVVPIARRYVQASGLEQRISTLAGDVLATSWPDGQDTVLMSCLLSTMPADSFGPLLGKAFGSLRPGGTILIHDFMLDDTRHAPTHAALWFLANAVGGPGLVSFSSSDVATLLGDSRFEVVQSADLLPGMTGLVRARKPP